MRFMLSRIVGPTITYSTMNQQVISVISLESILTRKNSGLFTVFQPIKHFKLRTEINLILGTSNWSADYFIDTAGVGFIGNQTSNSTGRLANSRTLQQQLEAVFSRDWNSTYALPIKEMTKTIKQKKLGACSTAESHRLI